MEATISVCLLQTEKRNRQTSVCLLQMETEVCIPWSTIANSANVPIYADLIVLLLIIPLLTLGFPGVWPSINLFSFSILVFSHFFSPTVILFHFCGSRIFWLRCFSPVPLAFTEL
jgi:hypothetical protein